MTKHAKKSAPLQAAVLPTTMAVEIPLPLLGVFADLERSFFDLCIEAGQQVLAAMMEQDREDLCGPRWKRDPDRSAGRAGTTQSEVTLGSRRIPIPRPRVRSTEGEEIELPSFAFASSRDPMDRHTMNAVACGISNRKYARSLERLPESIKERSTSRSSVSRRYVAMTTRQLTTWLTTPLGERHFPIVMMYALQEPMFPPAVDGRPCSLLSREVRDGTNEERSAARVADGRATTGRDRRL
jgi:hypothetical protein